MKAETSGSFQERELAKLKITFHHKKIWNLVYMREHLVKLSHRFVETHDKIPELFSVTFLRWMGSRLFGYPAGHLEWRGQIPQAALGSCEVEGLYF